MPKVNSKSNYRKSGSKMLKKTIRKEVNKIVNENIETKYHAITHTTSNQSSTALVTNLCVIPQGVNDFSRIGDEIKLSKLRLRFKLDADSNDVFNNFRILVFQWNADNTVDTINGPEMDKILNGYVDGATTSVVANSNMIARYEYDNLRAGKYTILYDKHHLVNTENKQSKVFNLEFSLYNDLRVKKKVSYKQSFANDATNALYLCVFSDSVVLTHPQLTYSSILTFKDA